MACTGPEAASLSEVVYGAKVGRVTQCYCSFCGKREDRVKRLIAGPGVYICDECIHLSQEILDEDRADKVEAAPSEETIVSEKQLPEALTMRALPEALESLSYRERRVLELRYGLSGEQPRTLQEIGATFKLTGEQIRAIENQSLKTLQSSTDFGPD